MASFQPFKYLTLFHEVAMASSPPDPQPADPNQIDRLSNLPDVLLIPILSLLPTRAAARTSVLCRRFRHLWEASSSLELIIGDLSRRQIESFVDTVDRVLNRDPSHPLLSLRVDFPDYARSHQFGFVLSCISCWLYKAGSLGLRHLIIEPCSDKALSSFLRRIFSINSLESLSLPELGHLCSPLEEFINSRITLTRLKSLSLSLQCVDPAELNRFLSGLCSLKDLYLEVVPEGDVFPLSSQTIRKLELIIDSAHKKEGIVKLSFPSLELFHLGTSGFHKSLPHIHGDVPLLRKAVITLRQTHETDVSAVAGLLNCISHAEELSLDIMENSDEKYPFPVLLEPHKDVPNFPNLKHLNVTICFHEHNFEAVIRMLHHCPALESLKLVHKSPNSYTFGAKKRKRTDWESKLPPNADGDYCHVYFTNLHLGNNSKEFVEWLRNKCSKRL